MRYIKLIGGLSLAVFCSCARGDGSKTTAAPLPNIVFVLLDAARPDHFSGYGYDKPTTPAIDAIAREGAVFLKTFAPATETFYSMPLIMSSRYYSKEIFQKDTWRWGVRRESSPGSFQDFDLEQIFLTDLLTLNGYRTAIVHDHWWFVPQTDFIKSFQEHFLVEWPKPTDGKILAATLSWIEENKNGPFFIYLHVMSPHQPYPPTVFDREFIVEKEQAAADAVRAKLAAKQNEFAGGWTPREIELLKALYDGNLRYSDFHVGELYSWLEQWDLTDNTLFILTSDHGEHLGQHNRLLHSGPPFDSVTHVPLIMVWPGRIPAGVRVKGLTELIDIMPTIVDLCGLKVPEGKTMDGVSLRTFINNPKKGKEAVHTQWSIRTPRYNYIFHNGGEHLFDVVSDPGEEKNLAESYLRLLKKLAAQHERHMRPFRERYLSARKTSPQPYSFYLPLTEFTITPEEAFQICAIQKDPSQVLQEISSDKAWLLNRDNYHGALFCLPKVGPPPPIVISIEMPDGSYRASALVESLGPVAESPEDAVLRHRFSPEDPFLPPNAITPLEGAGFRYLEWGPVDVKNSRFAVGLSAEFKNKKNSPFIIHHIRFDPIDGLDEEVSGAVDEEELERRKEGLKSLGYL